MRKRGEAPIGGPSVRSSSKAGELGVLRVAGSLLGTRLMSETTVERFMTHAPHTIGEDQPLRAAHDLMRQYEIRHLPVLRGGKLVGMLSQRDLRFIETLSDVDPEKVPVSDAMTTDMYAVGPCTTLRTVAEAMADHHYGSAVIVASGRVIGILTTVDGMRALSILLSEHQREAP
jgi:acetoin utilization protein AcuB